MQKLKTQFGIKDYRAKRNRLFTLHSSLFTLFVASPQRGIAALPTIVIIGTMVLLVAVALISSGLIENAISFGHSESQQAYVVADLGVQDAIMRIARNKNFTSAGYSISAGGGSAEISVSGTTDKTIISTGLVNNKTRKLQVVVSVGVCNGGPSAGSACDDHADCPSGGCAFGKLKQNSWEEIE